MKLVSLPKVQFPILFGVIAALTLSPIWAADRFINQDGSGHVNASYVMLQIIKGNAFFADHFAFNSPFVPNSSGHWLMVPLLQIFSPFVVTKFMMSVTFISVAAAVVWVRRQTVADEGLPTSLLIGVVLGFNWLWLLGSYNFILGIAGFGFTLGLYYRWREKMSFTRCCVIALLLAVVFLSHLISFLVLAGSIAILAAFAAQGDRKKTILWTSAALISASPLLVFYKTLSTSGEVFRPAWRSLADSYSLGSWITQITAVDPFVLISRRTIPFTTFDSVGFVVFSPMLWIIAAFGFMAFGTMIGGRGREIYSKRFLPFAILFAASMFAACFAPDDFGLTNGSLLRQRICLAGLVFAVPLFRLERTLWLKHCAHLCLAFVIVFQTAALWEYSLRSTEDTKDFAAAAKVVKEGQAIASIVIVEEPIRFHALPGSQMNNYLGIGKNVIVWDNYEMGHYLFPVVPRNPEDKKFVFDLTTSNMFYLNNRTEDFYENLTDLDSCLARNNGRIDIMVLWGRNEQIERILRKSFDAQAFYESGRIRLFNRLQ